MKKKANPLKTSNGQSKDQTSAKAKEPKDGKAAPGKSKPDAETAPAGKSRADLRKARASDAAKPAGDDAGKSPRMILIKARHESMKREIDQIREDLEAEEEE